MKHEYDMTTLVSGPKLASDPTNHCASLLDATALPDIQQKGYEMDFLIVLPVLRDFEDPRFHCRLEFYDALRQFLEVCTSTVQSTFSSDGC
jgi:hypothetical protein